MFCLPGWWGELSERAVSVVCAARTECSPYQGPMSQSGHIFSQTAQSCRPKTGFHCMEVCFERAGKQVSIVWKAVLGGPRGRPGDRPARRRRGEEKNAKRPMNHRKITKNDGGWRAAETTETTETTEGAGRLGRGKRGGGGAAGGPPAPSGGAFGLQGRWRATGTKSQAMAASQGRRRGRRLSGSLASDWRAATAVKPTRSQG